MKQTLQFTAKIQVVTWLIMVAGLILFGSFHAQAQLSLESIKKQYPFFQNRYYKKNVWDCSRSPADAVAGKAWTLSSFNDPYNAKTKFSIDFGEGRYLQFDIQSLDESSELSHVIDGEGHKYIITLNLYEADGTIVETISDYGTIQGLGVDAKGLFYEQEDHYGTFFTFENYEIGGTVTYTPEIGIIMNLSDLSMVKSFGTWIFRDAELIHVANDVTISNITDNNGKLTIGDNANFYFDGTTLNLSAPITDINGKSYTLEAIEEYAFKNAEIQNLTLPKSISTIGAGAFEGAELSVLHIQHETVLADGAIGKDAFTQVQKEKTIVYVPKGALSAYHTEDMDKFTVTNWQGFTYIMEEEGKTYDIEYKYDDKYKGVFSTLPDKAPVGQLFTFPISIDDCEFNVTTTNTIIESDLFSYKDKKFAVKLANAPTDNKLTIEIKDVSFIGKDEGKGLIIEESDKYKEGQGDTQKFNGTIQAKDVESLQIGKADEATTINIIVKETIVKSNPDDPNKATTTITPNATATLTLSGTNDLGVVENNGHLTFKKEKDQETSLGKTTITNNGTFTDNTGLILTVKGDASMTITPAGNKNILQGSKTKLTVGVTEAASGVTYTYRWEKQNENGTWPSDTPSSKTGLRSVGTNEYEVSDAGLYRCQITATKSSVTTTLTSISNVTTYTENPIEYYDVLLPTVVGATTNPGPGTYAVQEYDSFWFTLTLDKEYDQSKPVVTVGDKVLKPDMYGQYIVDYIQDYTTIKITGVIQNPAPVSVENADASAAKVWSADGTLCIYTPRAVNVRIVNMGGSCKELGLVNGDTQVAMPKGLYVVVIGQEVFKIAL